MKAIWEIEKEFRALCKPKLGAESIADWSDADKAYLNRKDILFRFWHAAVPGSRAEDSLHFSSILAWYNQGYDVSDAVSLIDDAEKCFQNDDWGGLERVTALIMKSLNNAPKNMSHIYHKFQTPKTLEEIIALSNIKDDSQKSKPKSNYEEQIYNGWLAQIAGGAYGTAIEGYRGSVLRETFGDKLNYYVAEPDTYNDDITFEIAFLEALESNRKSGLKTNDITSDEIAEKWLEIIPYAWSAEHYALENLRRGVFTPLSGSQNNYFSEWIGAQMRTMVCGLVAPANPHMARELAYKDSIISHTTNGVYAGIHSAVLTSLAFSVTTMNELLTKSRDYIPNNTMFTHFFDLTMEKINKASNHIEAWDMIEPSIEIFHWIHAIPNMVAVVLSLSYSLGDIDKAFRILGDLGLDVDCNAGEVGTILGVFNNGIDEKWTSPISGKINTYLPNYKEVSIKYLADNTVKNLIV